MKAIESLSFDIFYLGESPKLHCLIFFSVQTDLNRKSPFFTEAFFPLSGERGITPFGRDPSEGTVQRKASTSFGGASLFSFIFFGLKQALPKKTKRKKPNTSCLAFRCGE